VIINMTMNEPDSYYKMPLVGITETRARVGDRVSTQYTSRCGSKECWFVGHAATSVDAQRLLDEHACPTAPARNELPSGYSTVEKLWDEADDVMAAILEHRAYNAGDRALDGLSLQGYMRGLCFALSMMTHPYFRTITEVGRELQKRYKIRRREIPFEATPSYRYNPTPPPTPPPGKREVFHGTTIEGKAKTATRGTTRATTKKALDKIDMRGLSIQQTEQLQRAYVLGMFTVEELATNYGVSVETVRFLVTQKT
jgi:hypothetical protein